MSTSAHGVKHAVLGLEGHCRPGERIITFLDDMTQDGKASELHPQLAACTEDRNFINL